MKQNDWIALNLNIQDSGIDVNSLRLYNITPENTGLKDKDYYKTIPQVQKAFTDNTGLFNDQAFSEFYNSAKRSYNDFVSNDYARELINTIPTSTNDIFSLGNTYLRDDSAYIFNSKDPNRHTMGVGNIFETGAPSFSEREVAQANKVVDEKGKTLDWSPNDKGGLIKGLFRPTLALAEYSKDEYDEYGNLIHHKGEPKYNEFGDPYYEILGDKEIYGKDILRYADTITKEGTWLNKINVFDRDGLKNSTGKTIAWIAASILPYLTPYGYAFGAIKAATDLGQTIPVMIKMLDGMITNDTSSNLYKSMTSVENFMSRFGRSQSDYERAHRWGFEGIAQMVVDSAGQLYSQRLIQKLPGYLADLKNVPLSAEGIRNAKMLSSAYMATTSAKEVYGEYRQAGLNPAMSGAGALATMLAYYAFMQNEYFKDMLFRDAAIDMPELKILLNRTTKATQEQLIADQLAKNNLSNATKIATELIANPEKKWYKSVYNAVGGALKKAWPTIKSISTAESPYLYTSRSLNEGIEEVMEEGVSDFFKGLSLGLNAMGIDVKDKYADKLDFNYTWENVLERYATAFVGGAIGGAVFEGLTQWDNKVLHRNISRISDLEDLDEQLNWYIRNGYGDELMRVIDQWEKKGKFGTKNLSWNYEIQDGKIVYDQGTDTNNQNSAIANIIRQRIKYKEGRLETLGLNITDNQIIVDAALKIAEEAKEAGYTNLEKYQREKLRDARVDFLKQTGVDKFILKDIVSLQSSLMKLEEQIEEEKAKLLDVPDKVKSEQPKDTPTIKRLQKEYDKQKERLDRILSGEAASEYLQLSIYLSDPVLHNLYTSDLTGKNDTWYEKNVANFVRARYLENYAELSEEEKQLMQAEYDAWKKSEKREDRVVYSYNMHQLLNELITPIMQQQIQNYSGYKLEDGRSPYINAMLSDTLTEIAQSKLQQLQEAIEKGEDSSELQKDVEELTRTIEYVNSPMFTLNPGYDTQNDNFFSLYSEALKKFDISSILDLITDYYTQLNTSKTVSEFSDDILKQTFANIGERSIFNFNNNIEIQRNFAFDALKNVLNEDFDNLLLDKIKDPKLSSIFHDIVDNEGNVQKKSEAQILQDLYNAHIDALRNIKETEGKIKYNGKTDYVINHLYRDDILSELTEEDPDEEGMFYNPFDNYLNSFQIVQNQYLSLLDSSEFNKLKTSAEALSKSFNKDINTIKSAYNSLLSLISDHTIRNGQGVNPNSFLASLMFDGETGLIDKLNKLQQLRSEMIHTPILDWVNALSIQLKGQPTSLWQMLVNEVKGLESKQTLEEYTINDPFALNELTFLQGALLSAQAILRGSMPTGVNAVINKIREEDGLDPLMVIDNEELYKVYDNDLSILSQRVSYLLDLHEKNYYSTVKQKKITFVKNAPKIIQEILNKTSTGINEEKPENRVIENLAKIGIENISDLWNEVGGDKIVLSEVNEENFDDFWKVYRAFQNAIYDKVASWNPTTGNKFSNIAKALVSCFTDVWKQKTSNLTTLDSSKFENYDLLNWLASTIAVDPRITHGLIKTIKSKTGITPFFDQSLGIELGFATLENSVLFNSIVDELAESMLANIKNLDLTDSQRTYLEFRSKIYNAIFIDGASGTGKSQVELRFIKEMRNALHPEIKTIAVSEHEERAIALKNALRITDKDVYTKLNLFKVLLDRDLTPDDFVKGTTTENDKEIDTNHIKVLSEKTKKELHEKINNWTKINKNGKLDVYVDESGFLSEGDFQLLNESLDINNIHIVYAGDEMQNGCVVKTDKGTINSGTFDVSGTKSLRLNLSMRAGNLGTIRNLQHLESTLKQFLDIYRNEPWLSSIDLTKKFKALYGEFSSYKFNFYEDENSLYGTSFTDDAEKALEKLQKISEKIENVPSIVIITDNLDKWKNKRSNDIDVLTVEQVQGGEYQYALIDISDFGDNFDFDYFRNIYTLISRAKKGVYINGEIGELFPKTTSSDMDVTASVEVNATANNKETDPALVEYSDFWDNLYKDEIWDDPNRKSSTGEQSEESSKKGSIITPKVTGALGQTQKEKPGISDFNLENFLYGEQGILKMGLKSPYLSKVWLNKTERKDIENFQKYNSFLKTNDNNGKAIILKDFIDWITEEDSNEIIFGTRSILNGLTNLTDEQKKEYKRLIKGLSADLFQLTQDELKKKYITNTELKNKWYKLYPNGNKTWNERVDKVFNDIVNVKTEDGKLNVYSVQDGEYAYIYHVSNGYVFPIMRIHGFIQTGALQLSLQNITPQIQISTKGQLFRRLGEVVGEYADISDQAWIIVADPNKIPTKPNSGLRDFILDGLGKPLALLSSTYYDGLNVSEFFERVKDKDDPTFVHRIDRTGETNGKRRWNAVSNFVTFSEWIELAKISRLIKDKVITSVNDSRLGNLIKYTSFSNMQALYKAIANNDLSEQFESLRKINILSENSRDLLTTALIRYFFSISDTTKKNKFLSNLIVWNGKQYPSNDNKYIRQRCFCITLFGDNHSLEKYYIISRDDGKYDIVTNVIKQDGSYQEDSVDQLTAQDWLDVNGIDPIQAIKIVLNKIKLAKKNGLVLQQSNTGLFNQNSILGNFFEDSKFVLDDDTINEMFKEGIITIGIKTRSEAVEKDNNKIKNQQVTYFSPFDSDIVSLLTDITVTEGDELDKFLKSDSKFKYNFLANASGENIERNSDWIHTLASIVVRNMLTDLGLILPPLYEVTNFGRSNDSRFKDLGSLSHKLITDDPKSNKLTIDKKGEVTVYTLNKYFEIDSEKLKPYEIDIKSPTVIITSATSNSISIRENSAIRTIRVKKDPIDLFEDIPRVEGNANEEVLLENNDGIQLIKDDKDLKLRINNKNILARNLKVVYENNETIAYKVNNTIVKFDKKTNDKISSDTQLLVKDAIYIGETNDFNQLEVYYLTNNGSLIQWNISSNESKTYENLLLVNGDLTSRGNRVYINENIIKKLRRLGKVKEEQVKGNDVSEKLLEFANKYGIKKSEITQKMNTKSANSWLFANAYELSGIYVWNNKTKSIELQNSDENKILLRFARWIENEKIKDPNGISYVGQTVINSKPKIILNGTENSQIRFVDIYLNTEKSNDEKFTFKVIEDDSGDLQLEQSDSYSVKELTIQDFLKENLSDIEYSQLEDEDITNIILTAKSESRIKVNTNTESYSNWLKKVEHSELLLKVLEMIDNVIYETEENVSCIFKFD